MDPIVSLLSSLLENVRPLDAGEPAQYIPELASADPERFAMAAVGPRGVVRSVGEDNVEFTIQSVSKPFVLALALAMHGRDHVLARVGVEPSGEPFNAISLEPNTGRPANPLVNAGAIATTGLIPGSDRHERTATIVAGLSRFAGRALTVDEAVYESESETGDRNRALAHLMRSYGVLHENVDEVVESYFRQCSVLVTVRDIAVMAGTLAFAGRNPLTGEQVVPESVARDVVSIMTSCGMYDFSGEWLMRVGLPSKSGVAGGLVSVAPSQFGVGVFSPRLDSHGNSVRGSILVERLSREFGMHVFDRHESITRPGIAVERTSEGLFVRLGGELAFSGAERVLVTLRELIHGADVNYPVFLDVSELAHLHPAALTALEAQLRDLGTQVRIIQ
ncbi:glutaminase [Microbacterium endophyticum]|uniref:Glutaminase n=1 Tax=Microbacterium endophyticum TaxID=1526412 RepID=A0A7W4V5W1_9MICO|nr:glutaminase A [Microbacterium endophyticum]MBB2977044.1 glutaminase [Microbacterium endophyticum]NIK36670.1 glutaminase [Microbacterium endophyticum]